MSKKKIKRKRRRGSQFQYSYLREEINRLKHLLKNCSDPKESEKIKELLNILRGDDNNVKKYSRRKKPKAF